MVLTVLAEPMRKRIRHREKHCSSSRSSTSCDNQSKPRRSLQKINMRPEPSRSKLAARVASAAGAAARCGEIQTDLQDLIFGEHAARVTHSRGSGSHYNSGDHCPRLARRGNHRRKELVAAHPRKVRMVAGGELAARISPNRRDRSRWSSLHRSYFRKLAWKR